MEFEIRDKVMLKVSPWKGVVRFGKHGKLNPRYVGPFRVLAKVGKVAYRLELPQELSIVHHTFHVSNLKKCYADEPLVMLLEGIRVDDKLQFVEEPAEIMKREIKRLKRSRIPLVKVLDGVIHCLLGYLLPFRELPAKVNKARGSLDRKVLAEWTYSSGAVFILVLLFSVASKRGLRSALSSTSPLLFLGFARLVSTTGVDYQVHVGEYGVHWNFFFTLAGVAVLTSIINVSPKYCGLVGSLVLIDCLHLQILGYQVCLMSGLNSYLLSAISQNKEGIYSISGELIFTSNKSSNCQMLAILMLSDFIPGGKFVDGVVNLSVDTLFVSQFPALLILVIYCFLICPADAYADYNGFKLKFW
ncbi:putative reverse transcriptase domain-containing protein [Tanacetum coccineum]